MSDRKELNGSVTLLAEAMRKVFTEAVEAAVEPLGNEIRKDIEGAERRINANTAASMAAFKDEVKVSMADFKDDVLKEIANEGKEIRSGLYTQIAEQNKRIAQIEKNQNNS